MNDMEILTHQMINRELCGTPTDVREGVARVEMTATDAMTADASSLVHGGFIFGMADYAAMLAVNHPNVVLGAAEATFLRPVAVQETVVAEARVSDSNGRKQMVQVVVKRGDETVFKGNFTCFVLERHVMAKQ
jgi:uncharacterized protein (TIGR00369 family)